MNYFYNKSACVYSKTRHICIYGTYLHLTAAVWKNIMSFTHTAIINGTEINICINSNSVVLRF